MELGEEVKSAIKELPPAQRVVAIALKKIYEQIRQVYDQQQKQIDLIRLKFSQKAKHLQEKSAGIINGKKLTETDLTKINQYFFQQEKNNIKSILQQGCAIKDYWLVALENSPLKDFISESDQKILKHLINIQSKTLQHSMQVKFTFEKNEQMEGGTYTRIIQYQGSKPIKYKGDKIKLANISEYEFINKMFKDTSNQNELNQRIEIYTFINNHLIPYSLRLFLGQPQDQDQQLLSDEEVDSDSEQEEESSSDKAKGRKKRN